MTDTRWRLTRGDTYGTFFLVVEEAEPPHRGVVQELIPPFMRWDRAYLRAFVLPPMREELQRRLAALDRPVKTFDPVDDEP